MTPSVFTSILAEQVMGWSVAPDRFLLGNGRWRPRWRFQPLQKVEDAFELLDAACPEEFTIITEIDRQSTVRLRLATGLGEATHALRAQAITLAVARAIGINDSVEGEAE